MVLGYILSSTLHFTFVYLPLFLRVWRRWRRIRGEKMTHTYIHERMNKWMDDSIMMKRRANKTEQKNGVKLRSSDFLIIDRKKREKKNRERRERRTSPPSLHLNNVQQNTEKGKNQSWQLSLVLEFLLLQWAKFIRVYFSNIVVTNKQKTLIPL